MTVKSCVVVIGLLCGVILGDANFAQGQGLGFRGGASVNSGIGGRRNRTVRYYGPSFSAGPRTYRAQPQGSIQLQRRPWYYSRSGPIEYHRPYNPLYRGR
jgi:hypothetical protein